MASEDPIHNSHPIKMTSTTTADAIARVSHSNALSPNRDGGAILSRAELSATETEAVNAIVEGRQAGRLPHNGRSHYNKLHVAGRAHRCPID